MRQRAVVVDAEARRRGRRIAWCSPPAMLTARSARPSAISPAAAQRAAADQRAGLVHARRRSGCRRCPGRARVPTPLRRDSHGRDVRRHVDALRPRRPARAPARASSTPSRTPSSRGEAHGQVEPDRVERVVVAQVVGQELGRPHHRGAGAHGLNLRPRCGPVAGRPVVGPPSRIGTGRDGAAGSDDHCDQDPGNSATGSSGERSPACSAARTSAAGVDARSAVGGARRGTARRPDAANCSGQLGGRPTTPVRSGDLGGGQVAGARDVARLGSTGSVSPR